MIEKRLLEIFPTAYHQQLKSSQKANLTLTLANSGPLPLIASKAGGYGYLPTNHAYPHNDNQQPLNLLAQLNFAELPILEGYPTKGILAFYVDYYDDLIGCNFDDPNDKKGYTIFYFPEVDEANAQSRNEQEIRFDRFSREEDYPVVQGEYQITGEKSIEFLLTDSAEFQEVYGKDFYAFFEEIYPDEDKLDAIIDELWELDTADANKLGGYPTFTQTDPRIRMPEYQADRLLFQLNCTHYGEEVQIIWGDLGVGNFFINPIDLANLEFSKAWYNWDCS